MEIQNEPTLEKLIKQSKPGQFGNKFSYYFRKNTDKWNDPRLSTLPPDTFKDKRVLYIGCHEGVLPIQIALQHKAKSVCAIDIDFKLLKKAVHNAMLIDRVRTMPDQEIHQFCFDFLSMKNEPFYQGYLSSKSNDKVTSYLLDIVDFQLQNVLDLDDSFKNQKFDVICCLKVSKYVHLNFGDHGIQVLFNNITRLLEPDGLLLLQTQNRKSYQKIKSFCPIFSDNFNKIKIWPENFWKLLSEDFSLVCCSEKDKKNGFIKKNSKENLQASKILMYRFSD